MASYHASAEASFWLRAKARAEASSEASAVASAKAGAEASAQVSTESSAEANVEASAKRENGHVVSHFDHILEAGAQDLTTALSVIGGQSRAHFFKSVHKSS